MYYANVGQRVLHAVRTRANMSHAAVNCIQSRRKPSTNSPTGEPHWGKGPIWDENGPIWDEIGPYGSGRPDM